MKIVENSWHIAVSDVKDFIARLEDEIAVKNISTGNFMGFLA